MFALYITCLINFMPYPDSSVSIDAVCQIRGCEFEPQLGQYSFRHLTYVYASSFVKTFFLYSTNGLTVNVEKQPGCFERGLCGVLVYESEETPG